MGPIPNRMITSTLLVVILLALTVSGRGGHELSLGAESLPHVVDLQVGAPVGTTYHLSQEQGERQLDRLARTAETEDAWIYLAANSLWIDVGEDASFTYVYINIDPVRPLLAKLDGTEARVYLYHIHPRSILPAGMIYPPNANDIYAEANLRRALRQRYHATLVARVFDGYGRWAYEVTDGFEESLRLPDYSGPDISWPRYAESRPYESPQQLMMERFTGFLVDYLAVLDPVTKAAGESRSQRISTFQRNAQRLGILVSYVPASIDRH